MGVIRTVLTAEANSSTPSLHLDSDTVVLDGCIVVGYRLLSTAQMHIYVYIFIRADDCAAWTAPSLVFSISSPLCFLLPACLFSSLLSVLVCLAQPPFVSPQPVCPPACPRVLPPASRCVITSVCIPGSSGSPPRASDLLFPFPSSSVVLHCYARGFCFSFCLKR